VVAVRLDPHAQRDLAALSAEVRLRVNAALLRLEATGEGDVKVLQGTPGDLRLRVGGYRVILRRVDSQSLTVEAVIDRRDLDRTIARRR
jgi:mRNA-degrading endonuclease RelE of RelBE toxin-antitoxin system